MEQLNWWVAAARIDTLSVGVWNCELLFMAFYAAFCSCTKSSYLYEAPAVLHGLNFMQRLFLPPESTQRNATCRECKRKGTYVHFVVSLILAEAMNYKNKNHKKARTYTGRWWLSPCFPSAGLWSASVSLCCVTSSPAQTVSYVISVFLLSFLHPKFRDENIILKHQINYFKYC